MASCHQVLGIPRVLALEPVGGHHRPVGSFHPFGAVLLCDVAELALRPAGDLHRFRPGRQALDLFLQGLDEGCVQGVGLNVHLVVPVDHLAPDAGALELRKGQGQQVHVNHHLHLVGGPGLAGLDVDYPDQVSLAGHQVGFSGQGGQFPLDGEVVLGLAGYGVPFLAQLPGLSVQQVGVADLPPGQVADPFGPGPAVGIELGPEPVGPFAALVSRDELVQPGHPDIGSVLAEHRHIEPPLASLVLVSRNALDRRLTAGNPGRQWATVSRFLGRFPVVGVGLAMGVARH